MVGSSAVPLTLIVFELLLCFLQSGQDAFSQLWSFANH